MVVMAMVVTMAVDTVMVDTVMAVDTTVERDPLMPNPKPKLPLLPNLKLMPMPLTTEVTVMVTPDTVMVTDTDTAMVDTDTVTITARDLLNPNPTTMADMDMAVDTDTVDTVDTVMAVMVTTVELLLRIKSLDKFCLNNLAPTYPF